MNEVRGQEALPLTGLRVAVPATRRAEEAAALIRRWGGEPLVAPLLEELPVPDEAPLRAATEAVIASGTTWSVHLTGVGTRRWLERAESWGRLEDLLGALGSSGLIPRGQKAKAALRERGLSPAWVPEGETSSEIAAWLVPQLGQDDTVAVQLFGEPIPSLIEALEGTGATVIEVAPYCWALPDDTERRAQAERLVRALAGGEAEALAITSAVQATHLFAVARMLDLEAALRRSLVNRVFTAAVGEVARGGLEREEVPVDLVAHPARLGALVRSLAESAEQVRAKSAGPTPLP